MDEVGVAFVEVSPGLPHYAMFPTLTCVWLIQHEHVSNLKWPMQQHGSHPCEKSQTHVS